MPEARAGGPGRPVPDRLLATGALLALAAWHFRDAVFRGQVLFRRDVHLMWYTQAEALVRAVRGGEWPLWNPLIGFGQPLWADANVQVLYPTTWLSLVLPPWTTYTLYVVAHVVWGGLGLHLLGRRLGLRPAGALAASLLWAASGPLLSLAEVWNQLGGAAWIPWAVLGAVAALRGEGRRWAVLWGASHAAQVLAGAPECALMAAAGIAAWAAASRPWRDGLAAPARSATLALALALGLSAAQWAPALEASSRSGRAQLPFEARTHWSLAPVALGQTLVPVPLDRLPLTAAARQEVFGAAEPLLPSLYLGLPALGLVIAGALALPRRARLALAAAIVFTLLAALGGHTPAYAVVTRLLPPLAMFRYPVKAMIALAFAWALAAGRGTDAWRDEARWGRARAAAVALPCALGGLAVLALALTLRGGLPALAARFVVDGAHAGGTLAEATLQRLALAGSASLAIAVLAWRRRSGGRRSLAIAASAIAVLDLAAVHEGLSPTAPAALFTLRPPALSLAAPPEDGRLYAYDYFVPGMARAHLHREYPYRIVRAPEGWAVPAATALAMRLALFPPSAGAWGIAGSFDRDTPGLAPAVATPLADALLVLEGTPAHLRLLQVGGVSRVAALHEAGAGLVPLGTADALLDEPLRVLAVPGARPRAYAVGGSRPAPKGNPVAALVDTAFDPAREVLLDGGGPAVPAPDGFAATVGLRRIGADRVTLEADLGAPGYVVLVDAWDPGWRAAVDGTPAPVLRANGAFRAVAVAAGHHEVTMTYRPRTLFPALGLSLVAAGAAAAFAGSRPTSGTAPRA